MSQRASVTAAVIVRGFWIQTSVTTALVSARVWQATAACSARTARKGTSTTAPTAPAAACPAPATPSVQWTTSVTGEDAPPLPFPLCLLSLLCVTGKCLSNQISILTTYSSLFCHVTVHRLLSIIHCSALKPDKTWSLAQSLCFHKIWVKSEKKWDRGFFLIIIYKCTTTLKHNSCYWI